ncbi:Alkaline ceramidase 3 [Chytriomyces hyalinus]|nr:Alkaline ceramidase 3 [Chytriomyces hyalinus]
MGFGLRPAGNDGRWGPPTSTLDWCEENYVVTPLIAEFWNATSNLFFILLTVVGLFSVHELGVTEARVYLSLWSIGAVGMGSFLFHSSLWYETQMMDELPMIYGTCISVFALLRVFPETNRNNHRLAVGLFLYSAAVTAMYLRLNNPVFHEVCYGIIAAILFLTPAAHIRHMNRNYPQYSDKISGLWNLYWYSVMSYLMGFCIWGVDNNFCEVLRGIRAQVGYPWRIVFELHLFWHFGTAVGSYASVMVITYLRLLATGRTDVYLKWMWGVFPLVSSNLTLPQIRKMMKNKVV